MESFELISIPCLFFTLELSVLKRVTEMKLFSTEGVTYEVDDSQENYDDIDASSEAAQTRAEVHDGPQTSQKTDEAALQEPVQKDEDYLVPGQDGWAGLGLEFCAK